MEAAFRGRLSCGSRGFHHRKEHKNRPAFNYVTNGVIHEYRNDAKGSGLRKAGEITTDADGLVQWWRNVSSETVRLYVVDLVKEEEVDPAGRD